MGWARHTGIGLACVAGLWVWLGRGALLAAELPAPANPAGSKALPGATGAVPERFSSWTPARALPAGGAALAALAGALGWVAVLARKSAALREELRERRRAEAQFQEAYGLLEQRVQERTQALEREVTEQRRTEQALARERDLLRALLDNVPDAVYYKDLQSRFLRSSRAMAVKFGLDDPSQMTGKTDFDFFTEEHARPAFEDEQRIIRTGQPIVGLTEKETLPDGSVSWALTSKLPLRDQAGAIVGTFGISKDVTALIETEQELARARDAALASTRLKSEFLANMSHEVRTPLNGVIGMVNLLLGTPLDAEQRDFAETARNSAETLLTIINDILDFSKIEAGKLYFEAVDFDLRELVESTLDLLAERAQSKGIELALLVQRDVPTRLRGDPGRLRQVLLNLVNNGIKFTEEGEVLAQVSLREQTETEAELHIEVRDTGMGVSPQVRDKLFQPFSQGDSSTARRFGGTGLGLAICARLVELMQGRIGVESEVGRGSSFWFTVRLAKQPATTAAPAPPRADAATLQGVRVLIVDDNHTNRKILHYQMAGWQMRNGQSVADGPQALAALRDQAAAGDPFQLAVLDYQMPGMDGLALARAIKSDPVIAPTKLVMLTSMCQRLPPEQLRAAGVAACLVKPVKQSQLYDCLVDALAGDGRSQCKIARGPSAMPPAAETAAAPKPLKILLAEDNAVNQKVALRQLKKLGYTADAAANGLEVLEALRHIPYDVILMDCHMPEMDGYEAARLIRAGNLAARPVRIIAMTADAMIGDREKCLAAGMDDYITKPVSLEDLQAALVRSHPSGGARPATTPQPPRLDAAKLAELRELADPGEPDAAREFIELYLQDSPAYLQQLREALAAKDPAALKRSAHALKGSSRNLGAERLAALCAQLEACAKERAFEPAAVLLPQIEAEFGALKPLLESQLAAAPTPAAAPA